MRLKDYSPKVEAKRNLARSKHVSITKRVRRKEASKQSISEFQESSKNKEELEGSSDTLFDLIHDAIVVLDQKCKIVSVNPRTIEKTGFTRKELLGNSFLKLIASKSKKEARHNLSRIVRGIHLSPFEIQILKKNRENLWVEANGTKVKIQNNPRTILVLRDTTRRKIAEQEMLESEDKYRAIVENSPNLITIIQDGLLKYVNKAACERSGWTFDELTSPSFNFLEKLVPPRFQNLVKENIAKRLRGEPIRPYEISILARDGTEIPVIVRAQMILYHGKPADEIILIDITERKRMEEAIQESQRSLEAVVETAGTLIVLTDLDGHITLFNRACEELTGYKRDEAFGKTITEFLVPPKWIPVVQKRFADPYAPEVRLPHENPWLTKSGDERLIEWRCTVLPSPKDGRPCILGTGNDITQRKRMEERMGKLNECFLGSHPDPHENINRLVAVCGELLGADCALYNRLDQEMLASQGQWKSPRDYNPVDKPEGHICYDVIKRGSDDTLVVRNLQNTPYAHTDRNVVAYNLQTYVGHAVKFGEAYVGSLCVVYQRDFEPCDEDKKLMGILASAIGVEEERKRAEDELRRYSTNLEQVVLERTQKLAESERRFRELVELLPQIVFEMDEKGNLVFLNHIGFAATGYTEDDLRTGLNAFHMFTPEDHDRARISIGKLLCGEKLSGSEYRVQRKDGGTFPVIVHATRVMDQDKAVGLRGVVIDITERRRMEEKLRKAERMAGIGETASMVGHDLRNPLQVMVNRLYLAKKASSALAFP